MTPLETDLRTGPYCGYAYAYPHKTAYRRLDRPEALDALWAGENRQALFLYLHVPFCEMRCGFCNLFTQARPEDDLVGAYLDALTRQVRQVKPILGETSFARFAIGGGTPTFLSAPRLERLFDLAEEMLGGPLRVPASVETSPETADWDRLDVLRRRGVSRGLEFHPRCPAVCRIWPARQLAGVADRLSARLRRRARPSAGAGKRRRRDL